MGRLPSLGTHRTASRALLALAGFACSRSEQPTHASARPRTSAAPSSSATSQASNGAPSATHPSTRAAPNAPAEASIVHEKADAGLPGLMTGELFDIGPAAPSTATADGIVLVSKDDRVVVAARTGRADRASFASVEEPQASFSALGRGPSVAGGRAYFVSKGKLVRRAVAGASPLELLNEEARPSSRAAAVELGGQVAVAFLGRADSEGTSHARLWVEGKEPFDLTPEGAGASSVALTRLGDRWLATVIDGRSAMTPLHARTVELHDGNVKLGADVVVWVGGPAQAWTETFVAAEAGRAWALTPIERDATHFGLASVDLGAEPRMDGEVAFFDYSNGIDLAPVSTAELCGRAHVAFVRPTTPAPHSPQELVLARLRTNEAVTLANARGFASVSLASAAGGGVVSYVADGRTWARGLGCH